MIKHTVFILFLLHSLNGFAASVIEKAKQLQENKDYLGLRIYLKKNSEKINYKEWREVRRLINENPSVGYDLVFKWDSLEIAKSVSKNEKETKVSELVVEADKLFQEKKFQEASGKYQEAAKALMKNYKKDIPKEHQPLYYWLLQQTARSLYGMEDYAGALTAYSWIPLNYYNFRQIMFEKMWAGFRSKRYDVALGAIISQQSSYFSPYIEPDSYLLKHYIYKQFCNEKEAKSVVSEIQKFIDLIKKDSYKIKDWAKQDFYTFSLLKLTDKSENTLANPQLQIVSQSDRDKEISAIKKVLDARFSKEKERLVIQLDKVLGYSIMIKKSPAKELEQLRDLPDSKVLSETGFEYWTYKDQEEWTDEVGSHYYIGESQCK